MSVNKEGSTGEIKKMFKPDTVYTLSRIFKQDDKVIYKFTSAAGDVVNAPFTSVTLAEDFISEINGDDLPDYDSVYKNMTD
jgi:hypothetical protein